MVVDLCEALQVLHGDDGASTQFPRFEFATSEQVVQERRPMQRAVAAFLRLTKIGLMEMARRQCGQADAGVIDIPGNTLETGHARISRLQLLRYLDHVIDDDLTAKIAAMSVEECSLRLEQLADSGDLTPEEVLESAKLLYGPDAKWC